MRSCLTFFFHDNLLIPPVPCISGSCIDIKINLNFYFHTSLWCLPVLNEKLKCKNRQPWKRSSYDEYSIGVFKKDEPSTVIYLLNLTDWLIILWKRIKEKFVSALVVWPRKREVRLVVPAKFTAVTKELRVAIILSAEVFKVKIKYTHFELSFVESKIVKQPLLK